MRVAIAAPQYFKPHDTFITRHIQNMFDGNTCVICNTEFERGFPETPFLAWRNLKPSPWDYALRPITKLKDRRRYGTKDLPWGRQKRKIIQFLKAERVEIIFAEMGSQLVRMAPIADVLGIPIFSYFRGADATSELKAKNFARAYRKVVPKAHAIFSVSRFLLDKLAAEDIYHPNAFVIPSGVDTDHFKPGEKIKKRCVAVGRMIEKKSPLSSIRAFCDLAEKDSSMTLEMIGGGPLLEECERYVKTRGMANQVFLKGERPHDEVLNALKHAEIFLQHSVTASDGNTEGLPTAIQEAMSCGCAILSTRHAGIPEAVEEGVNGLLVDEHDVESYRGALSRLTNREVNLEQMMARSRERAVVQFDNGKLLAQTEDIIRELVKKGAPSRRVPLRCP